MASTFVYLIGCPCRIDGTPFEYAVKVGITSAFGSRLGSLATGNPHPIDTHFVFEFPNRDIAYRIEQEFHRRFDHARLTGEWFALAPNDALFLLTLVISRNISPSMRQSSKLVDAFYVTDCLSSDEQNRLNGMWLESEPN